MKKLLILSLVIALFNSCSKDSPSVPDPKTAPKISAIPSGFLQKIVIENFTMTSCGDCPKTNLMLDSLVNHNPGRVYGMTIHVADVLEDTSLLSAGGANYYDSLFNSPQIYPSGMVNRHLPTLNDLFTDDWPTEVFSVLGYSPSCGIAIEAEDFSNNHLHMIAHVGFIQTLPGQYNLHAVLVEDQVASADSMYDQMNNFSSEGSSPDTSLSLYNLNDTIHQYSHHFVLRKVLSTNGPEGDPIPLGSTYGSNHYTAVFDADLTGFNTANCYILVYIDKYATTFSGHRIENVQLVRIGETKDWN
jgi:hypothetical protein